MKFFDFYRGFEGENEILIKEYDNGQILAVLSVWSGYFDQIIKNLIPVSNMKEDVFSIYNSEKGGWYEELEWEIKNKREFMIQLNNVNKENLDNECIEIINILLRLLKSGIKNNRILTISQN